MSETPRGTGDKDTLQDVAIGLRVAHLLLGAPHNERVLYLDMAFQSILAAGAITFLNVYLIHLGANNWLVTAFSSLPALLTIVFAIPVGVFIQGQANLVRTANWGRFIFQAVLGLFAFLALLPPQIAAYILVAAYGLIAIPGLFSNVAVVTILGQATPIERRTRMLSIRLAVNGLVASIVGFLAGRWLNGVTYPLNYQVLFISGFVAGLASIYTFSKLRMEPQIIAPVTHQRFKISELINIFKEAPLFRRWSLVTFSFRLAVAIPQALYIIYKVRDLGASDAWIGVLILVENGLSVLTYLLLGRFSSRPGFTKYFWLTLIGTALYPIAMALSRTPQMLVIPSICSAVFSATMSIFISNTLYKVLPKEQQATFIAADTLLANGAVFIGPMLGAILAGWVGLINVFYVAAGLRALTALLFWVCKVGTD
jgi:MFS family permease